MKTNKILFCVLTSIFIACTNEGVYQSVNNQNETSDVAESNSHYVCYEQALSNAISFMSRDSTATRSADSYKVASHYEYSPIKNTRSNGDDTIDVRFHVINFADKSGFALVAADDRTTPLYAYSYEGSLDINDAIANTGFAEFMENAKCNYIYDIENASDSITIPSRLDPDPGYHSWVTNLPLGYYNGHQYYMQEYYTTIGYKSQMLTTAWGQKDPFNYEMPICPYYYVPEYLGKYPAGCGPVALAQIFAYHESPTTYIDAYGVHSFPWSSIKSQSTYSVGDYSNNILVLAHVITQIHSYAPAYYSTDTCTTTTYIYDMPNVISQFNYSCSSVNSGGYGYPNCTMHQSLDNNMPVYARGENDQDEGHAWVIDGYRFEQKVIKYYHTTYPYSLAYTIYDPTYRSYYHCNWGWNGLYNAYCLSFNANGTSNDQYNDENAFIYNIHPN